MNTAEDLGSCDRASWAKCEGTKKSNKMQQSDVYYQLLSQHVSGIIMRIFRRSKKTVCYCVRYTALVLLDVVGSGCGALRCRMWAFNMFRASLCPSLGDQRPCVTAYGVLRWFCWMWLLAIVGRCVVWCEHCSHPTTQRPTTATNHNQHNQRSTPYAVTHGLWSPKEGQMMPETCWDRSW